MEVDVVGAEPHGEQTDVLMHDLDDAASSSRPLTIIIPPVKNHFSHLFLI